MSFWKVRFDRKHALSGSRLPSAPTLASGTASMQRSSIPADEPMTIVAWEEDHAVLKVGCRGIQSRSHACELGKQISDLLSKPEVRVLRIDLAEVPVVNSEMLSQFTRAHCRASQLGKVFRLENLNSSVQEVFYISRLDRLFAMNDSARAAASSLS